MFVFLSVLMLSHTVGPGVEYEESLSKQKTRDCFESLPLLATSPHHGTTYRSPIPTQCLRVQELCESRDAVLGSPSLTVIMVSVDVQQHWT